MPRGPRYRNGKFRVITPNMLWDAEQKKEEAAEVQARLNELTVYRKTQEGIAAAKRKQQQEEHRKEQAARLKIYTCPFCGSHDPDHRPCPVLKKMQKHFSETRRPISSGVPYEFAAQWYKEHNLPIPTLEQFKQGGW